MPKPTYNEVWKRAKNLGKENYVLRKTVAILSNFLSIIRLIISAQKNGVRSLRLNFIIRIDKYEPCRVHRK